MKSVVTKSAGHLGLALLLLLAVPYAAKAQDAQTSAPPMDEKARQRAERDAKKAAEQEEKALRAAAEKERKEAEAETRERERAAGQGAGGARKEAASESQAPSSSTPIREEPRNQQAEQKARTEAEKARKKEEDRVRAQDAKDAERRRKDEERAGREALKARETEDRARAQALKTEQEEGDRTARRTRSGGEPVASGASTPHAPTGQEIPQVPLSKDEEKRRKELVKQIEKARAERDRLNGEAEAAERIARSARGAANEGQRNYEALTTGLQAEDVTLPPSPGAEEGPRKNRFVTKTSEQQAAASKGAPQNTVDPLRVALDLKNPDAEARERAAFTLASLGPDAVPATRALMAALADANPAVRVAAAQALGRIGTGASMALAPLSAALTDPDPAVKNAAQAALLAIQGR